MTPWATKEAAMKVETQLPIVWLSLPDRLRAAAAIYQWLSPLLREAATRIEDLERR